MKNNKTAILENTRQSNFELLRILAMIMIILHHIAYHCIKIQLEDKSLYALGECFNQAVFFKRLLLPQILISAGKIGNIAFVLIAGYFLINKDINITKQIKKIVSQLLFTVPILVLCSYLCYKYCFNSFTGIQDLNLINNGYWFVGYYIGIIIISYFFLNGFIKKLTQKDYLKVLCAMFVITMIAFLRNIISDVSEGLITLFVGVFIYALGGYIRLHNPFKYVRTFIFVIVIIISLTAICVSYYNNTLVKIVAVNNTHAQGMYQQINGLGEYGFFNLLIGVSLFEIFKRIKIKTSKAINYVASSTFIIYLCHDNDFIRSLWKKTNWVKNLYYDFSKFLILCFVWVMLIFIFGVLIYTSYCGFLKIIHSKPIKKWLFYPSNKE